MTYKIRNIAEAASESHNRSCTAVIWPRSSVSLRCPQAKGACSLKQYSAYPTQCFLPLLLSRFLGSRMINSPKKHKQKKEFQIYRNKTTRAQLLEQWLVLISSY